MPQPVIVAGARTPIGKLLGGLTPLSAPQLGGAAIAAALQRAGITGDQVDSVILGNVVQAGVDRTRRDWPLPPEHPAAGPRNHGQQAVPVRADGHRPGRDADRDWLLGGGGRGRHGVDVDAPHLVPGVRGGLRYGGGAINDALDSDALICGFDGISMGAATDLYQTAMGNISREAQDAFAAVSTRALLPRSRRED